MKAMPAYAISLDRPLAGWQIVTWPGRSRVGREREAEMTAFDRQHLTEAMSIDGKPGTDALAFVHANCLCAAGQDSISSGSWKKRMEAGRSGLNNPSRR